MSPKPITENTLFYGDNLPILREYVADESIDLIYPKIQISTVEQLMKGKKVEMPSEWGTFKQAPKADQPGAVQRELGL